MKKKIGFLDLHLDEWHANNYPAWLKASPLFADCELGPAWEESPAPGGLPQEAWCRKYGMTSAGTMEEVVAESDFLFVLAPSNPEVHERLSEQALRSGKRVYVDKPFAPDRAAAKRMFDLAEKYGTALMSSSALRFADEILQAKKEFGSTADFVSVTGGGGNFPEYGIHQREMIVSLLGANLERERTETDGTVIRQFFRGKNGKKAELLYHPALPFTATVCAGKKACQIRAETRMFENMLDEILRFFHSGIPPVPKEETIAIAALGE